MSLKDALATEKDASRKGPLCGLAILRARLDKADLTALDEYLADRDGVTTASIHRALLTEGHRIGKNTIERHRRGDCSCRPS
jgi:ABC-type siderophore export system fused ATPase/permease subunit